MTSRRWLRWVAILSVLALVAAACGGDDDGDGDGDAGGGGGTSEVTGFDGTTITLGVITPQTGPVAVIGNPLTRGQEVFFQALNEEEGGIAGKFPVELTIADSQYDAATAVQQYDRLKNDVVFFAQLLGTPIVNALLEQLDEDNVIGQPASLDSFWVREPNLIPLGAPYQIQAINAMSWVLDGMPMEEADGGGGDEAALGRGEDDVICWAGHEDPYGDAGLAGMEFAAEELGFELAAEVRFASTDSDPATQGPNVARLSDAGCTVVFVTATPSTAGALLGAAATGGYAPTWIGQSPTWVNALAESPIAPYLASSFFLTAEGPEWGDTSSPGMAQMIEDIEAYASDQGPDIYFAFGYAAAWASAQVLEEAVANSDDPDNPDLSREAVKAALASLDTVSVGGLLGDYQYGAPEDRVPPRGNRMFKVAPGEENPLVAVTDVIESDAAKAFEFS